MHCIRISVSIYKAKLNHQRGHVLKSCIIKDTQNASLGGGVSSSKTTRYDPYPHLLMVNGSKSPAAGRHGSTRRNALGLTFLVTWHLAERSAIPADHRSTAGRASPVGASPVSWMSASSRMS